MLIICKEHRSPRPPFHLLYHYNPLPTALATLIVPLPTALAAFIVPILNTLRPLQNDLEVKEGILLLLYILIIIC